VAIATLSPLDGAPPPTNRHREPRRRGRNHIVTWPSLSAGTRSRVPPATLLPRSQNHLVWQQHATSNGPPLCGRNTARCQRQTESCVAFYVICYAVPCRSGQACSTLSRARGSAALLPLRGRCHHDGLHVARPVVVDEGWARRAQAAASPVPSRAPAPSHARQEYDLNTTFRYNLGTCQDARGPVCFTVCHGSRPCRNNLWIALRASLYSAVTSL
jgi:hypothetical protein